jgi:hypothetical protein
MARLVERFDHRLRAYRVVGIVDPDLRKGCIDGKLAREAGGVRVEDPGANASVGEEVEEEVSLRQVGRGVDALQNFTDSVPPIASSLIPERFETL